MDRTRQRPAIPIASEKAFELVVGQGERGHLRVAEIEEFGRRVASRFPWVCRLVRVTKDGKLRHTRPTILRLDQIASHLPSGGTDPGNIIPIAIDGSFSPDGCCLRMNLFLADGTTPAQRETAFTQLCEATDLFDVPE